MYTINLDEYRPPTDPPYTNDTNIIASANIPKSLVVTKINEHSPPLKGSFKMAIDSVNILNSDSDNFDYNIPEWKIEKGLREYYKNTELKVYRKA